MEKFADFWILLAMLSFYSALATEFSFDLKDGAEECFFESIAENTFWTLEFYVVSGENHDIDVLVEAPSTKVIYQEYRKNYETLEFNATESGVHKICFNNKFSSFTDKTIFMAFEIGKKDTRFDHLAERNITTYIENAIDMLHSNLDRMLNSQTEFRMQEAIGRRNATSLNDRVMWWSLYLTFMVFAIGVTQVFVLRKLFDVPKVKKSAPIMSAQTNFYR